jgi:DNA-binding GntR family transcriptional regulator
MGDLELGSWSTPSQLRPKNFGETARDRVARELRSQILMRDRKAGERIDIDALAQEFGVSRTPIREACLALEYDKLVKMAPRSGVTVIGVSVVDLKDNFALMAMLAGQAAAWAAERATDEDLAEIEALAEEVKSEVAAGRSPSVANYRFHRRINRASHSARLGVLIAQTAGLFPEDFFASIPEQIPCSLPEHEAIVAALKRRDPDAAKSLNEAHFHGAAELLDAHIEALAPVSAAEG